MYGLPLGTQQMYLVETGSYIHVVPFVISHNREIAFLKTIFPSRKMTRQYPGKNEENRTSLNQLGIEIHSLIRQEMLPNGP